jgi:hypothetical protein
MGKDHFAQNQSNATYVKYRTGKYSNTWVLTVKSGYKVTGVHIKGYSNNTEATITMTSLKANNVEQLDAGLVFPVSETAESNYADVNKSSIEVSGGQTIVCTFDNSNITGSGNSKNSQIMAAITLTYELDGVAAPVVTQDGNNLTMTSATGGSSIYYTLDGSEPTGSSTLYEGAIVLENSCTVRAITIKGEDASAIVKKDCYVTHASALAVLGYNGGSLNGDNNVWTSTDGNYIITNTVDGRVINYADLKSSQDGFKFSHMDNLTLKVGDDIKVTKIVVVGKSWLQGDAGNAGQISFEGFTPETGTFFDYPTDGETYLKTLEFTPTSELSYGATINMKPKANNIGVYIEIYGVKRVGPADPVVVGGDAITWDFSTADAQTAAGSVGSTGGQEYSLKATNESSTITWIGGSSSGYGGSGNTKWFNTGANTQWTSSQWRRYFILEINAPGTLTFTSNSSKTGAHKIYQSATDIKANSEAFTGDANYTVTTDATHLTVTSSKIDNADGKYIYITFGSQIYIEKIVWTPASDDITLTTSDNMAGWRAFNPDGQGYTLDENTTAYIVESAPADNTVTLVKTSNDGKNVYPNTPVILYTTSAADSHKMTLTASDAIADYAGAGNLLKVTTAAEAITNKYRLGYKSGAGNGVGFYPYSTASAAAGIVYLDASSSGSSKVSIIFEDDMTTNISNLNVNENLNNIATMYNLAGQKVGESYKGIVIVNGKKMIRK